jgi:hypothetical protein
MGGIGVFAGVGMNDRIPMKLDPFVFLQVIHHLTCPLSIVVDVLMIGGGKYNFVIVHAVG